MKDSKKFGKWIKNNFNLNTALLVILVVVFAIDVITRSVLLDRSRLELEQMRAQVAYLQDTMNIVQTDVTNLETNISRSLEQENSVLESWTIEPCSANFAENTYDLRIELIPKTYTDTMKASIFFGSKEFPLSLEGHSYVGTVILPLDQNYDGNVTVLFSDGTRKTTEVLSSYLGLQTRVKGVLSGSMDKAPSYKDGLLKVQNTVHYSLNANTCFSFDNLLYVVQVDDKEVYLYDLIDDNELDKEEIDGEETYVISHDKTYHLASESGETTTAYEAEIEPDQKVVVMLRATTDNGFSFEYELFNGYSDVDGDGFAASFSLFESHYNIIDNLGGTWYIY